MSTLASGCVYTAVVSYREMFLFSEACVMLDTVYECVKVHMTYHVVGEMMNDRGVRVCVSGVVLCAEYLAVRNSDGEG